MTIKDQIIIFDPLVPTVFHNDWWLNACSDGKYEYVEYKIDNKVVGRLPFVINRKKTGHMLCTTPELCEELGPAIDSGKGNPAHLALKSQKIAEELVRQLGRYSNVRFKLHMGLSEAFAFMDAGFIISADFTSQINPVLENEIWNSMRDKTRNVIRKSEKSDGIICHVDPEEFSDFYNSNLLLRGRLNTHSKIKQIAKSAIDHSQGNITGIKLKGKLQAAIFVAFDNRRSWLLLTSRKESSGNGDISLLIWNAIKESNSNNRIFDFDGITTPGSRMLYSGFGGKILPRIIVSKHSMGYKIARNITTIHGINNLSLP